MFIVSLLIAECGVLLGIIAFACFLVVKSGYLGHIKNGWYHFAGFSAASLVCTILAIYLPLGE